MDKILFLNYDFNFKKTASSRFFYDFLCENYDVDVVFPVNNEIPYDEINAKNYFAIISFYYQADFSKLTCNNLIYVPMYDGFVFCREKMQQLKNVKLINFCKYLHNQSVAFGFNSFYIKYFPEPQFSSNNKRDKLFYWQRRDTSFSEILRCFPKSINEIDCEKTILHSVTDGENELFIKPTDEEIKNYNIEITNWFENKSDLLDILDTTKYYIAPRKQEGIGLSFLDAMSRGCVIIAHNDHTMDEYIQNGKNGYLINFDKPEKIQFHNYERIQQESIKSFEEGRKEYLSKLPELVSFINKVPKTKIINAGYAIAIIYFIISKIFRIIFRGEK